jgi:hypothetical protein
MAASEEYGEWIRQTPVGLTSTRTAFSPKHGLVIATTLAFKSGPIFVNGWLIRLQLRNIKAKTICSTRQCDIAIGDYFHTSGCDQGGHGRSGQTVAAIDDQQATAR